MHLKQLYFSSSSVASICILTLILTLSATPALHAAVEMPVSEQTQGASGFLDKPDKVKRKSLRKKLRKRLKTIKDKPTNFLVIAGLLVLANMTAIGLFVLLAIVASFAFTLNAGLIIPVVLVLLLLGNSAIIKRVRPEMPSRERWLWALGIVSGAFMSLFLRSILF